MFLLGIVIGITVSFLVSLTYDTPNKEFYYSPKQKRVRYVNGFTITETISNQGVSYGYS